MLPMSLAADVFFKLSFWLNTASIICTLESVLSNILSACANVAPPFIMVCAWPAIYLAIAQSGDVPAMTIIGQQVAATKNVLMKRFIIVVP